MEWYDKLAAFIADSVGNHGGVGRVEQHDAGVGDGTFLLINQDACQVTFGLVRTFDVDAVVAHPHFNRIVADDLLYGIGDRGFLQLSRHAEVFEVVIYEGNAVVAGLRLDVF